MNEPADNRMYNVSADQEFVFSCGPHVGCFNECCRDLNQFLTPYDVLRLRNHLGMTSTDFLETYTLRHDGPMTGLPVITLRPREGAGRRCPFVGIDGCRVYEDRPASCRMYPVARMARRDRKTGRIDETFLLIREPHCMGFSDGPRQTAAHWMENQGLGPYNAANDRMIEIIGIKQRHHPGGLPQALSDRIYVALYDQDRSMAETSPGQGPKPMSGDENDTSRLDAALQQVAGWLRNDLP